jgi:hypothetical protein
MDLLEVVDMFTFTIKQQYFKLSLIYMESIIQNVYYSMGDFFVGFIQWQS